MLSLGLALLSAAAVTSVTTCESLQTMSTPQVVITVESVAGAPATQPGAPPAAARAGAPAPAPAGRAGGAAAQPLPAYCRVKMVLKPTADSKINAELWL